ncbi:hypothetical protein JOM56_008082 [Amanita muscaria]
MLLSSDSVQCPTFPAEIISEMIGYLHDDKKTLHTLSLVSKQTLYESRHHLFSTVPLYGRRLGTDSHGWDDFDRFLQLVDVAWTSFTPTIQCIRLQPGYDGPTDDDSTGRDIPLARFRKNLPNVKSLHLSFLQRNSVPSFILDLVFQLHIEHFSLYSMRGYDTTDILNLFRRFPPSLRTLDLKGMRLETMSDLSKEPSNFHRPFRFETLDSESLLLFQSVWDPSICHNLDIKVKSFWLQPVHDQVSLHQRETPFISRFLQRIGPSLENLKICMLYLYDHQHNPIISSLLDPIHVSQCINLRSLRIEGIKLDDQAPDSATMVDIVQKVLSALPSPRPLQEMCILIRLLAKTLERRLTMLLKWSSLVESVQRLFPNLKKLAIHISTGRWKADPKPYLDLLRRVDNIRDLEEEGVIKLVVY